MVFFIVSRKLPCPGAGGQRGAVGEGLKTVVIVCHCKGAALGYLERPLISGAGGPACSSAGCVAGTACSCAGSTAGPAWSVAGCLGAAWSIITSKASPDSSCQHSHDSLKQDCAL